MVAGLVLLGASSAAASSAAAPPPQVEPTAISAGGEIAGLLQANPSRFRTFGQPDVPNAPPLVGITWEAINFNQDAGLNGFFQIPPDPSGAVGTTHVVNVVNSAIEWYTKAGLGHHQETLSGFFSAAPTPPQTLTFDPKVIWDQYSNRFVVTTMERIEASGMTPNQSRVYFAVSDDADPNGTWHFFTLDTEETITSGSPPIARQTWADFPGLAVDSEAIYYTNNQFAHNNQTSAGVFQGQRLRIIAKAPFYSGGAPVSASYDPAALAFANAASDTGDPEIQATTMQPAQMYGDSPGGVGTYLVAYSGLNNFVSGSDSDLFVQVITVDSPLSSPVFTGYRSKWGTIQGHDNLFSGLPGAPQNGTTRRIATNDRRVSQNAVHRNGMLYFAAPVLMPSASDEAGEVSVHWWKIDPAVIATNASDPPPADQGNIGGESIAPGTYTFYPAVTVDVNDNLAFGFAASAPTIYPGAYYTTRLAADPAGATNEPSVLRPGDSYYIRDFTSSMTITSRWGDYSGIWLDPSGTPPEIRFCVYNEYAMVRGTVLGGLPEEDGRWATAWGCGAQAAPIPTAVRIQSFRANSTRRATVVSWRAALDLRVVGYNVFGEANGKRVKLNPSLVVAKGAGASGVSYRFTYRPAARKPSMTRFWLQSVTADGSRTWHGPVQAGSR